MTSEPKNYIWKNDFMYTYLSQYILLNSINTFMTAIINSTIISHEVGKNNNTCDINPYNDG